ncbi:phosphatase PAP2 family protein [Candidatus Woesearchaeota archaeon]|nr:MAG: phosphatase PAP2 family protein [Candidatus Woesearchaeota archaeon]
MQLFDALLGLPRPVLHHWGYWVILLAAMLEASPLFGLAVPGQVIVVLGGFLVKLGVLDIGDALFVAILGAILGDFIGYWLGKKYGYAFITRYGKYVLFRKKYFDKTKQLMRHHTGKTLFIGRFNSLTRAFAPFVAGASGVPLRQFLPLNILGGIAWGIVFIMIGYLFGSSYQLASRYIGEFVVIAVLLSIIIISLYRFINKRKHIFEKYHLYALITDVAALYLFAKMVEDVIDGELVTHLDAWLSTNVMRLWSPTLTKAMMLITSIANPLNMTLLSLLLFGLLIYKKKWYSALLFVSGMLGGFLLEFLTKLLMHRPRPEHGLIVATGYSFPSGHATMAIIFFTVVLLAFKDDIKHAGLKHAFITTNILLSLLIGASRVYLNVHWLSDVLAGFSLGLFWLTFLILLFRTVIALVEISNKTLLSIWRSMRSGET